MKKNFLQILFIIITLCLLLVLIVGIYREYKLKTLFKTEIPKLNETIVNNWLKALKNNDSRQAIISASEMIPKSYPYVPIPYYLDMTSHCGINSRFFNPPFTIIDYLYWKDSYDLKQLVNNSIHNKQISNIPEYFFNEILNNIRLKKKKDRKDRISSMFQIWENKECDLLDKYLLFSEIMTQAGYKCQIIVLFSEVTKTPIHLLEEVRRNEEVYICDFKTGRFLNKSFNYFLKNKLFLKNEWKIDWTKGPNNFLFKTEIPALSYRKINQQLHSYLIRSNNKEIPTIGIDPYEYMIEYKKLYYPELTTKTKEPVFILGIEPFSILKNSNFFPKIWIINKTSKN